ncbi:Vacuolar protein sorting-associated protein 16 [Chionoecetes opilio]|uniref:Vacuolar protein sorting-associated protein 16 n=1 Tax=Chionoecetes opilio TaxID=41210 RepID=A0A8J4Y2R6_CHIOP|nr:Vacuolar protein sorting-associated protein 16 [Chionoecetes opilio]
MVPQVVVDTLGIGSMAPGALLLEASKGFQAGERSTQTNDCLAMIKESMEEAVNQCLQAAQHQYQPQAQKMLLRAALFGKSFIPEMNPEPCKRTIFTLRVLNAVRDHRVGESRTIRVQWGRIFIKPTVKSAACICMGEVNSDSPSSTLSVIPSSTCLCCHVSHPLFPCLPCPISCSVLPVPPCLCCNPPMLSSITSFCHVFCLPLPCPIFCSSSSFSLPFP